MSSHEAFVSHVIIIEHIDVCENYTQCICAFVRVV